MGFFRAAPGWSLGFESREELIQRGVTSSSCVLRTGTLHTVHEYVS